jgi:hypothetical protein
MAVSAIKKPVARPPFDSEASSREFSRIFFEYLKNHCELSSEGYAVVGCLEPGLVKTCLEQGSSLAHANHPIKKFLELVVNLCRCFDSQSGHRAEALMDAARRIVIDTVGRNSSSEAVYYDATHRLARALGQHNTKGRILEKRVVETEYARLQSTEANALIKKATLEAVSGKLLPDMFFQFLHEIWEKYLYVTYLREGPESDAWKQGLADAKNMAWCLATSDRSALFVSQQRVFDTLKRVRAAVDTIHINGHRDLANSFFDLFHSVYVKKILGTNSNTPDPVEKRSAPEASPPVSERSETQSRANPAILSLKNGNWCLYAKNGLTTRHKLIEINNDQSYLLFCNLSGIRSIRLSFRDAEEPLSSSALHQIDFSPVFGKALDFAHKKLPLLSKKGKTDQIISLKSPGMGTRSETGLPPSQMPEPDAYLPNTADRGPPRDRLRQSRVSDDQDLSRRSAPHYLLGRPTTETERNKNHNEVLLEVARMRTGGWAYILTEDNESIVCRLGLKVPESGELVFVDATGKKRAQLHPDELAHQLARGNAAILDFGLTSDDC